MGDEALIFRDQQRGELNEPQGYPPHTLRPRALRRAQRGALQAEQVWEDPFQPPRGHPRRQILGNSPLGVRRRDGAIALFKTNR